MNQVWGYNVTKWILDENNEPHGVLLQIDNGDTQYMTIKDYNQFIQNRQNDQVEA